MLYGKVVKVWFSRGLVEHCGGMLILGKSCLCGEYQLSRIAGWYFVFETIAIFHK